MLGTYPLPNSAGAVVLLDPSSSSSSPSQPAAPAVGISYSGPYQFLQATCPTWMDQHQMLRFPPAPGPDGYYVLQPSYSIRYLPPAAAAYLQPNTTLHVITHVGDGSRGNGSSAMMRVGALESFGDEPVPLTEPVRALVQAHYQPDYTIVNINGSNSLAVTPVTPAAAGQFYTLSNPQPLIPLNASTVYVLSARAYLLPPPAASTTSSTHAAVTGAAADAAGTVGCALSAWLACGVYEADDFNVQQRLAWHNSTVTGVVGRWLPLSVTFTSPVWVSYADLRLMAVADCGNATGSTNSTGIVYFDNFLFAPAASE